MQKVTEGVPLPPPPGNAAGLLPWTSRVGVQLNAILRMIGERLNRVLPLDGSERMTGPLPLYALTTANLPAASSWADSLLYVTDGVSGVYQSDGSTWSALGAPGRNMLINGDCEVWQRGAGGSASIAIAASATAYTCDMAYLAANANEASVVSQQAGLTNGSRYCARVQRNSGQTGTSAMVFGFPLTTDQVVALRGQRISISAVMRAGANWSPASGNVLFEFHTGTGAEAKRGAGFTGDVTVATVTAPLTTTATRFSATSASTVPTNATQGEVVFGFTPVGTAGAADYFEVDEVQLEIGISPTTFERRSFADELARCQRFYWKTFPYGTAPAQNAGLTGLQIGQCVAASTFQTGNGCPFPTRMRVVAAGTLYNPSVANGQVRNNSRANDCSGSSITNDQATFAINCTTSVGSAAGDQLMVHAAFDAAL